MRVIDNLDDLYFEVDTSHRPKIGTTVCKVVLLENAKRFVELEKVIAERRGRVEELEKIKTNLINSNTTTADKRVVIGIIENRLLELEKGDLK